MTAQMLDQMELRQCLTCKCVHAGIAVVVDAWHLSQHQVCCKARSPGATDGKLPQACKASVQRASNAFVGWMIVNSQYANVVDVFVHAFTRIDWSSLQTMLKLTGQSWTVRPGCYNAATPWHDNKACLAVPFTQIMSCTSWQQQDTSVFLLCLDADGQ